MSFVGLLRTPPPRWTRNWLIFLCAHIGIIPLLQVQSSLRHNERKRRTQGKKKKSKFDPRKHGCMQHYHMGRMSVKIQDAWELVVRLSGGEGEWAGYRDASDSGQKPGSKRKEGRQGGGSSNDVGVPTGVVGRSTATGSVSTAVVIGGSTVAGVTRDPAVITQRLVPQEVGIGRVGLVNAGEETNIISVRISVNGTNSCNVRVELIGRFCPRVCVHRKVEGLLNRPARVSGVVVDIPTGVFRETSVCLLGQGKRLGVQRT